MKENYKAILNFKAVIFCCLVVNMISSFGISGTIKYDPEEAKKRPEAEKTIMGEQVIKKDNLWGCKEAQRCTLIDCYQDLISASKGANFSIGEKTILIPLENSYVLATLVAKGGSEKTEIKYTKCELGEKVGQSEDKFYDYFRHKIVLDGKSKYFVFSAKKGLISAIGGHTDDSFKFYHVEKERAKTGIGNIKWADLEPYLTQNGYKGPACIDMDAFDGARVLENELRDRIKTIPDVVKELEKINSLQAEAKAKAKAKAEDEDEYKDEVREKTRIKQANSALDSCFKTSSKEIQTLIVDIRNKLAPTTVRATASFGGQEVAVLH